MQILVDTYTPRKVSSKATHPLDATIVSVHGPAFRDAHACLEYTHTHRTYMAALTAYQLTKPYCKLQHNYLDGELGGIETARLNRNWTNCKVQPYCPEYIGLGWVPSG